MVGRVMWLWLAESCGYGWQSNVAMVGRVMCYGWQSHVAMVGRVMWLWLAAVHGS